MNKQILQFKKPKEAFPLFASELHSNISMEQLTGITEVKFSPNGSMIVSGDHDGMVNFWDVKTGNLIHSLFQQPDGVNGISFSPCGTELITSGFNNVKIWDLINWKSKRNMTDRLFLVEPIDVSPDSRLLAAGGSYLRFWNLTSYEENATLQSNGEPEWVTALAFSPNGKFLASGHNPRPDDSPTYLKLWDVFTGEYIPYDLSGHLGSVNSVTFSCDGKFLASGDVDSTIKVWDLSDGSLWKNFTIHQESVNSIAFSPLYGDILASGGSDDTIKLLNITSDEFITIAEHTNDITSIDFSPDGTLLVSGSLDRSIKLWDLVDGADVISLPAHLNEVKSLAFSRNGTFLASSSYDTTIKIWDVENNYSQMNILDYPNQLSSIAFHPNSSLIAAGSTDSNMILWNLNSNQTRIFSGHDSGINSLFFSNDGLKIVTGSSDKTIKIWNLSTGNIIHNLSGHTYSVFSVALSNDDTILASASLNEAIKLWNVTTGNELDVNFDYSDRVQSLSFSPSGKLLATGSSFGEIRIWNVSTGLPISIILGHKEAILSVTFSHNGELLASSDSDGIIRIWNVTSGNETPEAEFQDLDGDIFCVTFSPKDSVIASGGNTKIKIWVINPFPIDFDGDGLLDSWEQSNGLNNCDPFDIFNDPDHDGLINSLEYVLGTKPFVMDEDNDTLPDGWEYFMGLDPFTNDALDDTDLDGIPNIYEYHHSLNARRKDGTLDQDEDEMSNLWEFQNGLNSSDPTDARTDQDGDWIINVQEYKGGSDPNNFWSVPLISFSALHFYSLLIIVFTITIVAVGYVLKQRKALIIRLEAPDYATALKIKNSSYSSFSFYKQAENNAKKLLESGYSSYLEGKITKALQQHEEALSKFEHLQNDVWTAKTTFNICRFFKDIGELSQNSDILQRFPTLYKKNSLLESLYYMVNAIVAEAKKDWISAKRDWKLASSYRNLDTTYLNICKRALIEIEIKQWLNNPSGLIPAELATNLDSWQQECETNRDNESLCSLLFLRARIALASYQFEDVTEYLDQCAQNAKNSSFKLFLNMVQQEKSRFREYKERITALIEAEKFISTEERTQLVQEYIKAATEFKKEFDEDKSD
ncbi:MAG: WD40 domain-containing protein [Candidatus Hodarchaeales archaeon]